MPKEKEEEKQSKYYNTAGERESEEQSFRVTSFAARFVFASPSARRRPSNEANGAVSPLPPAGALSPLPPTTQFLVSIAAKTQ
ncbi:unnamed protein product [Camellia sinensis]